jgi:AcrR family transcriptional regulator
MKAKKAANNRGRPRGFDCDQVLDRALQVFWRKGYEGASLAELTKAMGINRPSLYAAFGDKEALFRKALDRYETGPVRYFQEALQASTSREVAERLLYGTAEVVADGSHPAGCLLVQGALAAGDEAEPVRRELAVRRGASMEAIRRRLQRARREGDLPAGADPAGLARYLATILHGMAVQAAGGASANDLRRVAEIALRSWPG